ncbi:MAG: twin-arginine translocase TatA/TatE family subunit [Actinomycetota bacterium]|nr:twin-arginine translocase TatA/TatE family subunit [Actinomycetota bacterium]
MFGVGAQEVVIIVLVLLIVVGPAKIGQMARDVGKLAYGARRSLEEFKSELTSGMRTTGETDKARRGGQSGKVRVKEAPRFEDRRDQDRQFTKQLEQSLQQ